MKLSGFFAAAALLVCISACVRAQPPNSAAPQIDGNAAGPGRVSAGAPAGPGGVTTVAPPAAPPVDQRIDPLSMRQKYWFDALSFVAKTEHTPLFFDVDLDSNPPYFDYKGAKGASAMKMLARATNHRWRQIQGIQTFDRVSVLDLHDINNEAFFQGRALDWLQTLSHDEIDRLIDGKMSLGEIDPQFYDSLTNLMMFMHPHMASLLMDPDRSFGVELYMEPILEFTNAKTGQRSWTNLTVLQPKVTIPKGAGRAGSGQPTTEIMRPAFQNYSPLEASDPNGTLDFGGGSVLQLSEILDKAARAFKVRYYQVDHRVSGNWYFISGRYTQPEFDAAVAAVTEISPPTPEPDYQRIFKQGVKDALDNECGDLLNRKMAWMDPVSWKNYDIPVSPAQVVAGDTLTAQDFAGNNPALLAVLGRSGITPSTMVTLRPGLGFEVDTGGMSDVPGTGAIEGNVVKVGIR